MQNSTPNNITAEAPFSLSDLASALTANETLGYRWNIASDELVWTGNVEEVLGVSASQLSTGKAFANHLDSENVTSRHHAVFRSTAASPAKSSTFQIEYQFKANTSEDQSTTWLEDTGVWQMGTNGRPAIVHGRLHRVDERHKHDQNMVMMSTSDPLTGTINRNRMTELLNEVISNSTREHSSCGFAIAMVSNIGVISEAYGFEVSDEVILQISQRLRDVMRSGDIIARYSDKKFGFILNNCSPIDLAHAGERLLSAVRDNVIETSRGPVWANLSLGAVSIPESTNDTTMAIAFAEEALNEASTRPADACVVYQQSESRQLKHALNAKCATEIVNCLKDGSFKLAFQPIQDAVTGKIVMHEALLRMIDVGGEVIPAGHLIPVAEHIGLIRLIDRNVVQMAITALHSFPDASLSINISDHSVNDSRWNTQLIELLSAEPSIASRLVIELSETAAFANTEYAMEFIKKLQDIGCKVAIDNFGAGYTSFRNIRNLKINIIKIDGSYCKNLKDNKEGRFYARSLIELGKTFGLQTIAVWVESKEDADVLRELGIDCLQGNFLGNASIEPPWTTMESTSFVLGNEPQREGSEHVPEESEVVQEIMLETPSVSAATHQFAHDLEPASLVYDYEDGLAKLGATLAMLNAAKTSDAAGFADAG